jgi:thiol-disulfide isomerase/thioredoxin
MPLNIGDPAPLFSGNDVLTNQPFNLADHAGEIVVICFRGLSWCGPCKLEAPFLQEVWEEYEATPASPKVQFVMVSVNDTANGFKNALESFGITMPAVFDQSIWGQYLVEAVPTVYVLNTQLKVCNFHVGVPSNTKQALIDMIIACGGPEPGADNPYKYNRHWMAAVKILFGVTGDGGGLVITPGGKPIPIDPWGPLHGMLKDKKNILQSLAISEFASTLPDRNTGKEIEIMSLKSAEVSMRKLIAISSVKMDKNFSAVAKGKKGK